ncbi:MAG: hypothetical protein KBC57_13800 [Neisseriaceae bacterium]|nr:hypothetical protein [Neisseriaceae bacterium]MBP6863416.1 hypothetical protein [Neisseriaceae bacterium]
MEIIIVPILAFLFFACIVFSLATALSGLRKVAAEHKLRPMTPAERRAKQQPALKKSGLLLIVATAALALLAILTFSAP